MTPEILYTLPVEMSTRSMRKITNLHYEKLRVGEGSREEYFGISFPESKLFFELPNGYMFQRERLTTKPNGEGDLVVCWVRIL